MLVLRTPIGKCKVRKSLDSKWNILEKTIAKEHLRLYGVIFLNSANKPEKDLGLISFYNQSYIQYQKLNLSSQQEKKIDNLLTEFGKTYNILYDTNTDLSVFSELLDEFEILHKKNPKLIKAFVILRGDLLTSDREIIAFMIAYEKVFS